MVAVSVSFGEVIPFKHGIHEVVFWHVSIDFWRQQVLDKELSTFNLSSTVKDARVLDLVEVGVVDHQRS